ncbi:dihydrolipoamide dehydrogenase [Microlunatus sagamiharensis]|uniref:Dihydrolipoyl dehydrogenase n=1 Tax=Microlunatus sagamiharensis TaxID=546874 RepID=A0A1H2MSE3_9ACTN|nr:dihydrolipoyl dehydrogenase [Microlunatus sagamiharensis]SDU96024.1 dihydrolipoamide dehydrogenase [Microlunatus sagamiharensis]
MTDDAYDLVVLGAGSGGYACALRAAQLGLSVALVERDRVGGTCLHYGCIPTKAILHAAEVADAARDGAAVGVHATVDKIDLAGVRAYAEGVVGRLHKGLTGLVASRGITVVQGDGRLLAGPDGGTPAVAVVGADGERTLTAPSVVLATGSQTRSLPGIEPDGERVLTSTDALRLETLPTSAVVLGGGVIGVEFASAWRSFGVEVTVVEALDRLVPGEDPASSAALLRAYRKRGITVRTQNRVRSVETLPTGVRVVLDDEAATALEADVVLVAVGRGPRSAGLGYEETGVGLDRGFVEVDERLRTAVPGVYAVGDLVLGLQLAHRGFAHGIFVAEDVAHGLGRLDRAPVLVADEQIPRVTYCDPEVASVGLSEAVARERFGEVETQTYDLAGNGRAQILRTAGFVKLVRRKDGPVVGVHMVGARVGELMGEAQAITAWEAWPDEVAALPHAHPTLDEALGEAHLALAGKPLHAHR